ncbi:MAG: metal-dependent hydrolase [Alphaproteobacteria bacterium]|nr:metal-dependent hydrolase [Alphaproteobacteria bacterium]
MYSYKPKSVEKIVIRDFNFDFPEDIDPIWIPGRRVRSHMFNGLSLTMPHLEPFLVKTGRETANHVESEELREDIRGFCGQESQHYKCHRRLNDVLRANGYPEFEAAEAYMDRSWKNLSRASLEKRLAYSAGFETMTNGFTRWLIKKRKSLFQNADPHITSFWIVHMIEETEHKTVALDCYMAYSGRYLPRFWGVFHGSFHVVGHGLRAMMVALKKDGVLHKPSTWWELAREMSSMIYNVGPFLLRALLPWHDARNEKDPDYMQLWVKGYETMPAGRKMPLIDTKHPDMPVPFSGSSTGEAFGATQAAE